MRLAFAILLAEIFLTACRTQPTNYQSASNYPKDSTYTNHAKSFIQWYRAYAHIDKGLILEDSTETQEFDSNYKSVLAGTSDLTSTDLSELKSYIGHPPLSIWTIDLAGPARLITRDTVRTIFKSKTDGWQYFYQHYGHDFFTFSAPIFLRHYTLCLFYSGNFCGRLCGEGSLCLYKKEDNKWVEIRGFDHWVS